MVALTVIGVLMGVAPDLPGLMVVFGGLLIAIPACMALASASRTIAYRPLRRAPRLAPLITAIGVSIILQNLAMLIWGRQYVSFPPSCRAASMKSWAHTSPICRYSSSCFRSALMAGLWLLVERTRLGRAMRATAQSKEVAELMGVNVDRVISATFVIGSAIAAIAGVMVSAYYGIGPLLHGLHAGPEGLYGGRAGRHRQHRRGHAGRLAAGCHRSLGAGYIGDLTGGFFGSHYQDVFAFFVLILVLVFRPSGLLGERVEPCVRYLGARPRLTLVLLAALLMLLPFVVGAGLGNRLGAHHRFRLLYVMLALGLNIVVGYAGLLDLGYIAFYAVGAYLYACWPARISACICLSGPCYPLGGIGLHVRRAAGGADAAPARRLPGHRHPGFRRNHPHLHEQPERARSTSPTGRRASP
jgi:branched-chain amino acid transport system permease protein